MGFIFNFDNFKKGKKKLNPFDLVDDFDYDFAESFEMDDYETEDGTGVRDYIHVVDLANGHIAALKAIENKCGASIYNMGTGHGYSVLDMVNAFAKVNGVKVPYSIIPRRAGDIATCYCNPSKAKVELG